MDKNDNRKLNENRPDLNRSIPLSTDQINFPQQVEDKRETIFLACISMPSCKRHCIEKGCKAQYIDYSQPITRSVEVNTSRP